MVIKTDIEKLEPAMTTTYGSINNNPELVAEPGTPMSVASQSPLRVNPLVRPNWQRNLWYYSMIFFTTLIALFIISRVTFLILKANGVNQHLHPADVINTNPADPDPDGQKRCRLCNFKECEMDYCPRLQTNYMCIKGVSSEPAPGCSRNAHQWINTPFCDECCSTEFCWLEYPTENDDTPSCPLCTPLECRFWSQTCPFVYPFVCTAGMSTHACTGDPFEFPASPTCTTCCNLDACWGF